MKAPFFRTAYNYDMDLESLKTGLECKDESLAVQSEAAEADINVIVKRFGLTGTLPENHRIPQSGDFVGIDNFSDAMRAIRAAEESFMELPASIRSKFDNDPGLYYDYCTAVDSDGKLVNLDDMRKLGLALPAATVAVPEPEPAKVENVVK